MADPPVVVKDDAGWCWYEDAQAVLADGRLVAGTVAAGSRGGIEVVSFDLDSGKVVCSTLHKNLQLDDHDSPARRPVAGALFNAWPGKIIAPSPTLRVTYSNLFWLGRDNSGTGRIYNFFHGYNNTSTPSWMFSDDLHRANESRGRAQGKGRSGFAAPVRPEGRREVARPRDCLTGTTFYTGEDDYAGGICLHPNDPDTVFISANANPVTGKSPGWFDIYRGHTLNQGATWTWTPVTRDSQMDNLRPVVPAGGQGQTLLLWLRGRYLNCTNYDLELVLVSHR